jgi:sulfite reductase (NADPH) flavoprotein alpha-component
MKRKIWLLLHRYLGISAGLVLAVVGVTGALLSFEDEILGIINRDVVQVEQRPFAAPLQPDILYRKTAENFPDRRVQGFTFFDVPEASVKVNLSDPNGGRRGEDWYIDPFTAQVLGSVQGVSAMHFIEDIHRRLLAGETGKALVGASALILIFMALSGIYLRLPTLIKKKVKKKRRPIRDTADHALKVGQNAAEPSVREARKSGDSVGFYQRWRERLLRLLFFKRGLKGTAFWWHLHAVAGTWVILFYLSASLTGLYFSYDWYRAGILKLAGVEQPKRRAPMKGAGDEKIIDIDVSASALAKSWRVFGEHVQSYTQVSIRLPKGEENYQFSYLDADSGHERASNRMEIRYADAQIIKHDLYSDKLVGEKLVASMLPLHTGSFYGVTGKIIFFTSSLMMPLFTFSGIWLYLQRRKVKSIKKKRFIKRAESMANDSQNPASAEV